MLTKKEQTIVLEMYKREAGYDEIFVCMPPEARFVTPEYIRKIKIDGKELYSPEKIYPALKNLEKYGLITRMKIPSWLYKTNKRLWEKRKKGKNILNVRLPQVHHNTSIIRLTPDGMFLGKILARGEGDLAKEFTERLAKRLKK